METPDEADATRAAREARPPQAAGTAGRTPPEEPPAQPPAEGDGDELAARREELRARVRAANRLSLAGPDSPSLGPPSGRDDGDDTRA